MSKPQPLHIANAHIYNPSVQNHYEQRDLYTTDLVVEQRLPNALTVDLSGCTIFAGLVNAHDHLELNHYPRTKFREKYDNAHQWGEDVNVRLNESPFRELRAYPLEDRCFIGGLKNLLCGATTVVHHNPPHKCLFRRDFPVRVLKRYGWAHSLHFSTDEEIIASYKSTPPDVPWFIHLAEGTDYIARGEYQRLKALGCVGKNTVIVHGVGLTIEDVGDASINIYGIGSGLNGGIKLIWCPSTNLYLLGQSVLPRILSVHARTAIASDSRLTADGDLLDELRCASSIITFAEPSRWSAYIDMVTRRAAFLTQTESAGDLQLGCFADFVAIQSDENPSHRLCQSHRADLALVVRGGIPQIGDPEVMARFPHIETVRVRLDDREKSMNVQLARQVARCSLKEPGLELLEDLPAARRWRRS